MFQRVVYSWEKKRGKRKGGFECAWLVELDLENESVNLCHESGRRDGLSSCVAITAVECSFASAPKGAREVEVRNGEQRQGLFRHRQLESQSN